MCLSACDYVDGAKDSCVPETLCIGGWSLVKLSREMVAERLVVV